ncbi:MAG: high-potential iron-sulfur protein [Candidatus Competibacteraceae bacterium]|nr:high-potential iron-sulfur protein [Candidatus Competibacteraceae bacterium]
MSHKPFDAGRRRFIQITAIGAAAAPLGVLLLSGTAQAQERLDPSDPMAQQLQYTHDSPKADQSCANCQLYGGSAADQWASCPIFGSRLVKGSGWCSAWVAKG